MVASVITTGFALYAYLFSNSSGEMLETRSALEIFRQKLQSSGRRNACDNESGMEIKHLPLPPFNQNRLYAKPIIPITIEA